MYPLSFPILLNMDQKKFVAGCRFIVTPTVKVFLESPLNWIDFVATLSFHSDMLLQYYFRNTNNTQQSISIIK